MKKTYSHNLSSHWLPVALHLGVGPCEISSTSVGMLTSAGLVEETILLRLYGYSIPAMSGRTISQQVLGSFGSYQLPVLSSACSLSRRCTGFVVGVPFVWVLRSPIFSVFDHLWISVVISICWGQKKLREWGVKAILVHLSICNLEVLVV